MKRKYIILLMLPVVLVIFALQSCNPKTNGYYVVFHAFTQPTLVAPLDASVDTLPAGTTTVDLSWTSANKDGDPVLNNVYFGTTAPPNSQPSSSYYQPLYKAGNTALNLKAVPVLPGLTYYWTVTMIDSHGVLTYGPVWSFTIFDAITVFTGVYLVDEPAEGWTYVIDLSKLTETTIQLGPGTGPVAASNMAGWWASWKATFTLDLMANTYSMPRTNFGGGYEGQESGTIDQKTGTLTGTYTVWSNGAIIEQGPHTYTKQ